MFARLAEMNVLTSLGIKLVSGTLNMCFPSRVCLHEHSESWQFHVVKRSLGRWYR